MFAPVPLTSQEGTMTSALLIIDVQQALCSGEYQCFDIRARHRQHQRPQCKARSKGLPVVLIQHEEKDSPGTQRRRLATRRRPANRAQDLRVRKTTPDSFYQTDLHDQLQELDVSRLIICGLQTDYCVNATVRQALKLGYDVVLAADAHSTVDNGNMAAEDIIAEHNKDLAHLTSAVARIDVVPANDIRP
jgi:nicotinamidase-related amidase